MPSYQFEYVTYEITVCVYFCDNVFYCHRDHVILFSRNIKTSIIEQNELNEKRNNKDCAAVDIKIISANVADYKTRGL